MTARDPPGPGSVPPQRRPRSAARLWTELTRRKVPRVTAAYVVVAWAAIEVADTVFPHLGLRPWTVTLVIALLLLGLPLCVALAWAYDITPDGVARTPPSDPPRPSPPQSSQPPWQAVQEIVGRALELGAAERSHYLASVCDSPGLRAEAESLLAAHDQAGILDTPPLFPLTSAAPQVPRLGDNAAHYRILELVGGGGMGVVYKARDQRLERVVALKFLPPHMSRNAAAKERFLVEAQAAASLDHPNICTIHEIAETEDGQLYLVMPFYDGRTLRERLEDGPLPLAEAVEIAGQVADGLARAHARGITHRDIKPANLVITAEGVVKIVDFGVAKLSDAEASHPGYAMGTVAYMSPEQARGERTDERTDIWSLGVVLYEMSTGEKPFHGESDGALLAAISQSEPLPPHTIRPDIPPRLEEVLFRALSKRAEDRYLTAREMAAALRGVRHVTTTAPQLTTGAGLDSTTAVRAEHGAAGAAAATPAADADRRTATVVVTMLAGYDVLLERLAPDATEQLHLQTLAGIDEVMRTHGGLLHEFSGDHVVMLFGVPVALEDDALRASRAALQLHEALGRIHAALPSGIPLTLHSGIDTGTVIVHPNEGDERAIRVSGAAPQIALRLAQQADAGEVWISAECRSQVSPYFDVEERDALAVRGRNQPLLPYRLLGESGLSTRIEAAARAGLTAFTGRDAELELLLRRMDEVRGGEGQLVSIRGEPGMGKSRLLHEFRQHLDGTKVLDGRCQTYGGDVAYLPFIDLLRSGLGVGAAAEVEGVVARIREVSDSLEEFIPLYLSLLSVRSTTYPVPKHLQGDALRLAMQEALAALVVLCGRDHPCVVILEDWHWADDASQAVLRQIGEVLPASRLLVLVTSRPGYGVEWEDSTHVTHVLLRPLEQTAARAMLGAVLGVQDAGEDLIGFVQERTGGNPFFIEELCHALREQGAITIADGAARLSGPAELIELPDSIHGVIRARLDRLERPAREVLRVASVIGREFPRAVLERSCSETASLPAALESLKAAGLVQQARLGPDAAYRFRHVLTQEVAYSSLLEHQRRELHGRVGTVIEQLHGRHDEDQFDRLAHHFSRAEQWERAVEYGLRSSARANRLAQFAEALQILERTQRWLARLPHGDRRDTALVDILLQQERLCETLGHRQRQQQIIDQLIQALDGSGDQLRLAEVYLRQGDLFTLLRRYGEADAALHRSLELRRTLDDPVGERNTLRSLGLLRWHEGRNEEALRLAEETLRIDRARGDLAAMVGDMTNCGAILRALGEHERARDILEEALSVARTDDAAGVDAGDELALKHAYALQHLANIYRERGDRTRALESLQRAGEIAERNRLPIQLAYHYTSVAHVLLQEGRIEEALQHYRDAIDLTRRARYASGLAQSLRIHGDVLIGLGRPQEALPHLQEAATTFAELRDADGEARVWRALAEAQEQVQAYAGALAAWSRAAELHGQLADTEGELVALEGVARTTRLHFVEPSLALAQYQRAAALAEARADPIALGRILNTMAILEWERGGYEQALAHYERCLDIFTRAGDDVHAGLVLNSIGATLKALGRADVAKQRLAEALALHRRTGEQRLAGHALALLADVHLAGEDPDEAAACYAESLEIRRAIGDRRGEGWMLHGLARCELVRDGTYRAREHLDAAARIAGECAETELAAACEQLRRVAG